MHSFPYASARDQIEQGYDPHGTIRDIVKSGHIRLVSLDGFCASLLDNYIQTNAEDGMTEENADLTERDFHDYIVSLIDEYQTEEVTDGTA